MHSDSLDEKYERLCRRLRECESLLVAFSGGVDSTLLVKAAVDVLGERVMAVTAVAAIYPQHERAAAERLARDLGVRHLIIEADVFAIENFCANPPERCYLCKLDLFGRFLELAREHGLAAVADGANADDEGDFRPGMRAAREIGVISPLREAGLTKSDVRALSKQLGLPTWDDPSAACLASRIPYGDAITLEKLHMIEAAEDFLRELGFRQVRVRHHGELARIEVEAEAIERLTSVDVREPVVRTLTEIGYTYVVIDARGYRTGSLNEVLDER